MHERSKNFQEISSFSSDNTNILTNENNNLDQNNLNIFLTGVNSNYCNIFFYYPIGNTRSRDLLRELPNDINKTSILLLGCGDMRHILNTLTSNPKTKQS